MRKQIYIDYENVSNIKKLPVIENVEYFVFLGALQEKIPKNLVLSIQESNGKFIDVCGTGKNALDFHIAYLLGKEIETNPDNNVQYYILTKDSGFDPLIEFVKRKIGNRIFRIVSLDDIQNEKKASETKVNAFESEQFNRVKRHLKEIQKSRRPKSENKLLAYIRSQIPGNKISEKDSLQIVNDFYRSGFISKANKTITYSE